MSDDGKIRVLLADDHAMVREGLASLLNRQNDIEVVGQCGDGLAVPDAVDQCRPDVVVLDISMPGLNGLDVCRELLRRDDGLAVLILSMHADEQFIVRALEYGAGGYVLKESAGDELPRAVSAVASGELFLGPGIDHAVLDRIARGGDDPYDKLTTRERQVMQLIAEGLTNRKAADQLGLAVKTVDTHRMRLMRKLGIHDQTNLVKFAIRRGMVSLD